MKYTSLLLFILVTPVLADDPQGHVSQTRNVGPYPIYPKQPFSVPTSDEQNAQSMAALASAREASITASQALYQWDKGAAAERDIQLERLHELAKKWHTGD
jgi:hypothetical protein